VERNKRQVFAALAIVTAFAVQGVVDYAGYQGIQGVEQELNDQMNTRAIANNVRFRQADNAIGNLSRQVQDLNSKVEDLSESETATVQLLLRTVRTQALEDRVLQQQISANQRTLVTLAQAHLQEATGNREQSDAQMFLLKTINNVLNSTEKSFLTSGVAYTWQLKQGMLRLQAVERQLQPIYQTDYRLIKQQLHNLTCDDILGEGKRLTDELDVLAQDINEHLNKTRNLSMEINKTRPEPIVIDYIPELDNLSLHHSGEIKKKAFNKVIDHPEEAIEEVGKDVISFVGKILGKPLKLVIIIVSVIIAVLILGTCVKKMRAKQSEQRKKQELQVVKQVKQMHSTTNL